MQAQRIKLIKKLGIQNTLDFKVNHKDHNFYAEGIVVSNSHAISYGSMCAATCYLKFKYPKEFYLCLLNQTSDEPNPIEEISKIQSEMVSVGIKLLGPHIIKSQNQFTIEEDAIRFSLASVKGIAAKTINKLQNFRNKYQNKFEIMQAARECGIPIGILSSLIQAGTLDDSLSQSRSKTVLEACLFNLLTPREKLKITQIGHEYNYDLFKIMADLSKKTDEKGKLFIKESRLATIRAKYDRYKEIYHQNSKNEHLCNYFYENLNLGYSYSEKLETVLKEYYPDIRPISEVLSDISNFNYIFCGEVREVKYWLANNSKKTKCLKVKISDSTGTIDAMMFNNYITSAEEKNGGKFEEKTIVVCEGEKKDNAVFCKSIVNQHIRIMTKLSELKEEKSAQKD